MNGMATRIQGIAGDLEQTVREIAQRYHVYYEVRPYYVVVDQRPAGAPPIEQKVQAGFDVNLYGALEKEQLPLFSSEEARKSGSPTIAVWTRPRANQKNKP